MADADESRTWPHLVPFSSSRRAGRWLGTVLALALAGLVAPIPGCSWASTECVAQDDGDPCTVDACDGGTPTHEYLGDGHPCFEGKREGRCDSGRCTIPCASLTDCDDGNPCTLSECQGGSCVLVNNDAGTPKSDGNPCTEDRCLAGVQVYWPKVDGTVCGEVAGFPDEEDKIPIPCMSGVCGWCATAADCGENTTCRSWECFNATCIAHDKEKGTPVFLGEVKGDCRRLVCSGHGTTTFEIDPEDFPLSADPCFGWSCAGWTPIQTPKVHVPCIMAGGTLGVCSEEGNCIQCIQDTDCPHWNDRCFHGICVTCSNGILDGDETDIDCGGSCGACNGTPCEQHAECSTQNCALTNTIDPAMVCCDTPCIGTCEQCSASGKCVAVPAGQPDAGSCPGPDHACNFLTQCKMQNGFPCKVNLDCASKLCDIAAGKCKPCTSNADCVAYGTTCDSTTKYCK